LILTVNTYLFKYVPVKLGFIILSLIGVLRIPEEFYLYKDKDKVDAVSFPVLKVHHVFDTIITVIRMCSKMNPHSSIGVDRTVTVTYCLRNRKLDLCNIKFFIVVS
jgi:hypothetical protein